MSKKAPKGWIKISEFEKLTGLSNKTITAAIKRGAIPSFCAVRIGTTATAPYYIDPQKSAIEWRSNVNINHQLSRPIHEALAKYITTFNPAVINPAVSLSDIVISASDNDDNMTLAQAQLKEKIAKARIAELELKEREGTLVQKAVVDGELFAIAQEIRNALLTIPDRIIDQVISESKNRNKAHNTIYTAIASELEKLADLSI